MKDKETILQSSNTMIDTTDLKPLKQSAAASQMTMTNQIPTEDQQQEESKGPSKAQELYKNGKGNFRCDCCEESFYSKKEYERHRKTANHKTIQKRPIEKVVTAEIIEESKRLSINRMITCELCNEKMKLWDKVSHDTEKHGLRDFHKFPLKKRFEFVHSLQRPVDEETDFDFYLY